MNPEAKRLEAAKLDAEIAKRRVASTMGALQYRLRPANLASDAWEGLRGKGEHLAGGAVDAVKQRPAAASGVIAAITLFLVRGPVFSALSSIFHRKDRTPDDHVTARIDAEHENFDLAAPVVERSLHEGVNA